MIYTKVKVVRSAGLSGLEEAINNFLETFDGDTDLVSIQVDNGGQGYYAVITYTVWRYETE